jgi:predicted permease
MAARRRTRDPVVVRLSLAAARLLLRAYPRAFRARNGAAMLQSTHDLLRARFKHARSAGVLTLWPRLAQDLLLGGLAERTRRRPIRSPNRPAMLDTLLQDLRFARRSLSRRPALTGLAVSTLALGIAASVSMFSVVDGVMLRPLPYPDSGRLTFVYTTIPEWRENPALSAFWERTKWSYDEFIEWHARQRSFSAAAVVEDSVATLTGAGEASRVRLGFAGLELFSMLGVAPLHGRLFNDEDIIARAPVALLAHDFWRQRFASSAAIVGERLVLDDEPYTVIGVLPAGFHIERHPAQVWLPVFENLPFGYFTGNTGEADHTLHVLGRLHPEVTPEMAGEELGRLLAEIGGDDHFTRHGGHVMPWLLDETRGVRYPLLILMAAVLLLLVVACANVATFLLGRAVDRQQEIAVRGALGAGGTRIARQLVTESLLLSAAGGALGLLLAAPGVRALTFLAPPDLPRLGAVGLDLRAAAFALLASSTVGLLAGLAPAAALARPDLARRLGAARHGSRGRSRLQASMIVAEVMVATLLLVGAGLLVRSFLELNAVDPGFDAERIVWVRTAPNFNRFRDAAGEFQAPAARLYLDELAEALRAVPGVSGASIAQMVPFAGGAANNNVTPEGYEGEEGWLTISERRFVDPAYHRVMGIPLRQGRYLAPEDDRPEAASVVLISENMARRFFPAGDAVGKKVTWWEQESEIVGVVGDVLHASLDEEPEMTFYAPLALFGQAPSSLVVRAEGDPAAIVSAARAALAQVDRNLPVVEISPLTDLIAGSLVQARYRTRLIVVFAVLAALLSALGLYGVTARAVASRSREIAIRVALGAEAGSVIGLVLRDALRLAAAGAVLGLGLSLLSARALAGFLYGVPANDPTTLATIAALVAGMAALAALAPSLRASRVDPVRALRAE